MKYVVFYTILHLNNVSYWLDAVLCCRVQYWLGKMWFCRVRYDGVWVMYPVVLSCLVSVRHGFDSSSMRLAEVMLYFVKYRFGLVLSS